MLKKTAVVTQRDNFFAQLISRISGKNSLYVAQT
ncbi:hypothetical protein Pvag_3035 [Pantoea vagans C9-1]|nr:hypothetical protein Pvag_3035 [Pantoea vagans C9-1]